MKSGLSLVNCLAAGLVGLAALLSSGCASVPGFRDRPVDPETKYTSNSDMYAVDIHPAFGKATRWEGPILKGMTVQSALEASGALGKIRHAEVELFRPVPENGTVLKLPAELQPNKRMVKYEQDYAILPGDRIVVRPSQSSNPLDQVLDRMR